MVAGRTVHHFLDSPAWHGYIESGVLMLIGANMKRIVWALAAMLGIFSSHPYAQENAYQIELIVFAQNMPNTEAFDQTASRIAWPSGMTELAAYKTADNPKLGGSYSALANDVAYLPLLHAAWLPDQDAGNTSAPVHIQSADGAVNGWVRLEQGQALQLHADLEYAPGQADSAGKTLIYRIEATQPVNMNEVYYLDHPKFGVIIRIGSP